jgi:hypothetical protein
MKNILPFIFIVFAAFLTSCNDNLSPKADFEEEYVLYCVLNADTTYQTAYISHTYQVEGYNGLENRTDPAIEGATVKLIINGTTVYNFSESSVPRTDTSRYNTPVKYYSLNGYKPSDDQKIEVVATLNNGKVLKSTSQVPPVTYVYFETSTMNYDPSIDDGTGVVGIKFAWRFLSILYNNSTNYFAPRLELVYYKADNPAHKIRVKVPYYFVPKNASYSPVYPNVMTGKTAMFYGDSVERVLNMISEGDAQKSNYIFDKAEFTLLLLDKYLAASVASETTFNDEFSMRIDATDFTNIEGGLGMFGISASKKTKIKISKWYIESFGYQTSY